jgi:hypothetical protein
VELLAPPTIAASAKKHKLEAPDGLNKYQHEAFFCACAGALKSQ